MLNTKSDLKKALAINGAEESVPVGFGPVQDINEIPGEFDMDIELGRRATNPLMSDPLSIEQGRRESMIRESEKFDPMQFSPLRTPTKDAAMRNPFDDNAPMMDDDYGALPFDENAEAMNPENEQGNDHIMPEALSPIAQKIQVKQPRQQRRIKKEGLFLDDQIEITNNQLQVNLRETADICLKESELDVVEESDFNKQTSIFDLPCLSGGLNEALFGGLFSASKPASTRASRRKQQKEQEQLDAEPELVKDFDNAPMMDDDYGFIEPEPADFENRVPEMDNEQIQSGMQSPLKRRESFTPSQASQSTMSRSTLDTLEIWKSEFTSAKGKTLSLESDLMTAMADQGVISKRIASSAFFEALVLRGKGLVTVRQDKPYAPITVQAKPTLFTAILTE